MTNMDILRVQKNAEDAVFSGETPKQFLIALVGCMPVTCTWVDPYFGLFEIKTLSGESKGHMYVNVLEGEELSVCVEIDE